MQTKCRYSTILNFGSQLLLIVLVALISFKNYTPNTWLSGFDNLHPEFNFPLNFKRNFFGTWQEFQGLGLLGGMSHASDLPRILFLWVCSLILPLSFLRYFWGFLMLFLGSLGVFHFLKYLLPKVFPNEFPEPVAILASLVGSLFYIFNLSTVQLFYTSMDGFVTHFGFLPWLLLYTEKYLDSGQAKFLGLFGIFYILGSNQAYTATLIFVFFIFWGLFLLRHLASSGLKDLSKVLRIGFQAILLSLFWLLPLLIFIFSKSKYVPESTISRMSSEESFLMNRARGNIADVLQLKGFWFDITQRNSQTGNFVPLLDPWTSHFTFLEVRVAQYAVLLFLVLGLIYSFCKPKLRFFGFLTILGMFFLMNDNPPFGFLFRFFQENIPLFGEALRFPFTKFSVIVSFLYSICLAFGFVLISKFFLRFNKRVLQGVLVGLFSFLLAVLIVIPCFPVFRGFLIDPEIRVKIPQEYFDMFDWLNSKDSDTRILYLPMDSYWAWSYYDWGYQGSGFPWYGLKQPFIARAFDVWSPFNEEAYWEISYPLYAKNPAVFDLALKKYNIGWVIFDGHMLSSSEENRLLEEDYSLSLLKSSSGFEAPKTFGALQVFKVKNQSSNISMVENASWVSESMNGQYLDPIYMREGIYAESEDENPKSLYPFFALTNIRGMPFALDYSQENSLSLIPKSFPKVNKSMMVSFPEIGPKFPTEAKLYARYQDEVLYVEIIPNIPKVSLNGQELPVDIPKKVLTLPIHSGATKSVFIDANNSLFGPAQLSSDFSFIGNFPMLGELLELKVYSKSMEGPTLLNLEDVTLDTCSGYDFGSFEYLLENGGNDLLLRSFGQSGACVFMPLSLPPQDSVASFTMRYGIENGSGRVCIFDEKTKKCSYWFRLPDKISSLSSSQESTNYEIGFSFPVNGDTISENAKLYLYVDNKAGSREALGRFSSLTMDAHHLLGSLSTTLNFPEVKVQIPPFDPEKDKVSLIFDTSNSLHFSEDFSNPPSFYSINYCSEQDPNGLAIATKTTAGTSSALKVYAKENSVFCLMVPVENVDTRKFHLVSFDYNHLSGKSPVVCLRNLIDYRCGTTSKLADVAGRQNYVFSYPSLLGEKISGLGVFYEFRSIGKYPSEGLIDNLRVDSVPGIYGSGIRFQDSDLGISKQYVKDVAYSKFQGVNYSLSSGNLVKPDSLLLLNQGYDPNWIAFCGLRPCPAKHVKVNSWANGWIFKEPLNSKADPEPLSHITLFFWPQILEYLGFLVIFVAFSCLFKRGIRETHEPNP